MAIDNVARGLAAACLKILGGIVKDGQSWAFGVRAAVTGIPAVSLRPQTTNTAIALDIMPNGAPTPYGGNIAWLDVVDTDCLVGNPLMSTMRVAISPTICELGAYALNGATQKPLNFTLTGTAHLTLGAAGAAAGNLDGANSVNSRSYFQQTNANAGTTAYVDLAAANNTGTLSYLRTYSSTFVGDSGNYQNCGEMGSNSSYAFNIFSNGIIRFETGGNVPSVNTRLVIDASGNASFKNPILSPTYAVSTPTTGTTVTIPNTQDVAIINPAGTLAALTVQLPTASATYDGKVAKFNSTQIITALTVTATAGTVVGAPSALTASQGVAFICQGSTTTWYRLY